MRLGRGPSREAADARVSPRLASRMIGVIARLDRAIQYAAAYRLEH